MKALRFLFPIALCLSKSRGKLTVGIIIHALIFLLYPVLAAIAFFVSWTPVALATVSIILIPIVPILGILSIALLFVLIFIGIIVPFYCAGGIILGVMNYKKELEVLADASKENIENNENNE
ncbi:MAG: hypothetical protein IJ011_08860 [Clostridia bacterium]|nr:hypothetical protein [Clostridia bacterium]